MITRLGKTPEMARKASRLALAHQLAFSREEKEEIERAVAMLAAKHLNTGTSGAVFSVPDEDGCAGDIMLGHTVRNGYDSSLFSLRLGELRQHLLVCGRSGSGKTNLVYQLLRELYKKNIPFLITDWKKDYADVDWSKLLGGIRDLAEPEVHVLSVGRRNLPGLQLNPLIPPPGLEPSVWAKKICEVFTHAYMGGPRFEQIIRDAIDHFYRKYGVYEGSTDRYPTIREIKEYLEKFKPTGREALWMQSVQSTLSSLCFGGTGETFDVPQQPPLEFLIQKNVVLELDALSNADRTFIVETLLLWIYHYRFGQAHAEELQSVVVLEEAHHLLRSKYEDEETIMDITLREIRSWGIGVVVVDQMPSLISKVALANNFARIALNLVLKEDKEKMASCMNLDQEQKKALGDLQIGSAIVKMQDRFVEPFELKIPLVGVLRVPRSEIPLSKYAQKQDSGRNGLESQGFEQNRSIPAIPPGINTKVKVESCQLNLDSGLKCELELLTDIVRNPVSTVVDRYKRLGMSPRKGNYAKRYLIREGWIEEKSIHGITGCVKLLKPTEKGEDMLRSKGIKYPDVQRHGGLEHKYWVQIIADHFCIELGDDYEVLEEYPIGKGCTADIVIIKNGKVVTAVEVETGKSDVQANIDKYSGIEIDKVIIAFVNQELLGAGEKKLRIPPEFMLTTTTKIANANKEDLIGTTP